MSIERKYSGESRRDLGLYSVPLAIASGLDGAVVDDDLGSGNSRVLVEAG